MVFLTTDSNINFWVSNWKIICVCACLNKYFLKEKQRRILHILFSLSIAINCVFYAEEECIVINVIRQ